MKPIADTHYPSGEYLLLFDPLDGSSNIDVNMCPWAPSSRCCAARTGEDGNPCEPRRRSLPAAGRNQVAAGFAVYGPTTQSWCSPSATALAGFTLDRETYTASCSPTRTIRDSRRHRRIRHQHLQHAPLGSAPVKRYIDECLAGKDGPRGQGLQHALGGLDGGRRVPRPVARAAFSCTHATPRTRKAACA